jgi:5,10-methylenetetrahydrofolate reductase
VTPYRDPVEQVSYLLEEGEGMDFALTQVVSHHTLQPVERFLGEARRRGLDLPIFAGIFFYRSANSRTLEWLGEFIPVPEGELKRDFGERGLGAEEVAAETLRRLHDLGFTRFYLSNLETGRAAPRLGSIAARAGLPIPAPGSSGGRAGRRR